MENSASFGDWLRRRRKALDMTQDGLAEQVGCSVGLIRKIESDERRPSRQVAELLAGVLQIPTSERSRFVQVARAQLRTERLDSIDEVVIPLPEAAHVQRANLTDRPIPPHTTTHPLPQSTLPVPPTSLIGRDNEVREIRHLLANPECRLLTIVGPGGMGKTRLALAVAGAEWRMLNGEQAGLAMGHSQHRTPHFADGVVFVGLAGLTSPTFMVPTIAQALGLTFSGMLDAKTQLLNSLGEKQLLLVLDNLEHLLEGVDLLSELLAHAAEVTLLATSRERLNLQGEWVFDLQGLPIPPDHPMQQLQEYSTVALFVERAQRASSTFALTPQNQADIVQICRLVDGMPLGIELAAAWVHLLSCQEIVQEIKQSIDFLALSRRDLPERHRSLRAVFDHSWQLLSNEEQRVMAALSVFQGGFTREAANTIAGASLPRLSALVAKSLVQRRETGRYDIHELVRQYARQRLEADAQAEEVYQRRLEFFAHHAHQAGQRLGSTQHLASMQQLEAEQDNLRAALLWSLQSTQIAYGFQLALGLVFFWEMVGYWDEGIEWLTKLLAAGQQEVPPHLRATALQSIGYLANSMGDSTRARQPVEESLQLWQSVPEAQRTVQDQERIAELYLLLGTVKKEQAEAEHDYEESLRRFRTIGNRAGLASILLALGALATRQGVLAQAQHYLQESLALSQESNNLIGIADAHSALGVLASQQGDYRAAQALHEESLQGYRALHFRRGVAIATLYLGQVAYSLHQYEQARDLCREALSQAMELNHRWDMGRALVTLAYLAQDQNHPLAAVQLFGLSEVTFAQTNLELHRYAQLEGEQRIALLRQQLGEETFATAWAQGRAMPWREALKLVSPSTLTLATTGQ